MTAVRVMSVVFTLLLGLAGLLMVSGCATAAKPVVLLYEPLLLPIGRAELQCLDERTYQALVSRELEWRSAWTQCKAVVDELADSPRPSLIDLAPAP